MNSYVGMTTLLQQPHEPEASDTKVVPRWGGDNIATLFHTWAKVAHHVRSAQ